MMLRQDARLRTTYERDELNRIWQENSPNDAQVTHLFDDAGRETYLIDGSGTTQYHYDNADRQTGVDYPGGKSLAYELDPVGNRLSLTDPDSGVTTYEYDPGNRLTDIHNPFSETTHTEYDALNREYIKTLANGMTIHHTYDAGGRETLLQHKNSSGTVVAKYDSTVSGDFDAVGNRLKVRELDSSQVIFGYDATYQLLSEVRTGSNAYTRGYEYDGTGNRTRKEEDGEVTLYHYGTGNRLMSQQPGGSSSSSSSESSSSGSGGSGYIDYGYDANGNLQTSEEDGQTTTYHWDDDDLLTMLELPDSTYETYTYSDGLRRTKTTTGGTTQFIWDDDNLLQETNTSSVTQAQYTHDPDGWGGLASQRRGGTSSFYGFDPQSNTRYLYNSSQTASDSYVLSAFGKTVDRTGTTPNPHTFGGEVGYENESSGLHYVRARYYDERSGRWISRDPLGFDGDDVNLYAYCCNNPTRWTDASGQAPSPQGHHLVPQKLWENAPKSIRNVFDAAKNRIADPLYNTHNAKNYGNVTERVYRAAVNTKLGEFLGKLKKSSINELTVKEAQQFATSISRTSEGVISTYNAAVRQEMREVLERRAAQLAMEAVEIRARSAAAAAARRRGFIAVGESSSRFAAAAAKGAKVLGMAIPIIDMILALDFLSRPAKG